MRTWQVSLSAALVLLTTSLSCSSGTPVEPIPLEELTTKEKLFLVDAVPLGTPQWRAAKKLPQLEPTDENTLAMTLDASYFTVAVKFGFSDKKLANISYVGVDGGAPDLYRALKLYCNQYYTPGERTGSAETEWVHRFYGEGIEVIVRYATGEYPRWGIVEHSP